MACDVSPVAMFYIYIYIQFDQKPPLDLHFINPKAQISPLHCSWWEKHEVKLWEKKGLQNQEDLSGP